MFRYKLRTLPTVLRWLGILGLLVFAVFCIAGFYCNAWIAQAGDPGPYHNNYVFASRFYGVLAMVCVAVAVGIWMSSPRRTAIS